MKYSRRLVVLALVAACVVLSAHGLVRQATDKELGGQTDLYFSNTAGNLYPTDTSGGDEEGATYTTPTLAGTFTVQGSSTAYTSSALPAGLLSLTGMTLTEGNVVITGNLPLRTSITVTKAQGTVKANTPLIDTSAAVYSFNLVIQVVDSTLSWSGAETVANSQVMLRTPISMLGSSAAFITGATVSRASAIVGCAAPAASSSSMRITANSVVAVDYTTCDACQNGFVYSPEGPVTVQSNSLLRVSHSNITASTPAAFVTGGAGDAAAVSASGLVLIENVSAPTTSVFSGNTVVQAPGKVVVRYASIYAIGSTLDAQTSYADVTIASSAASDKDALSTATAAAANTCPAACLNSGSLATPEQNCKCTCTSSTSFYADLCTVMYDPLVAYVPKKCGNGCSVCFNETACITCGSGFTLDAAAMTCSANSVPCPENCKTCSAAGLCLTCEDGYALVGGICSHCEVDNCITCSSNNVSQCTMCASGSAPVNNACPNACSVSHCKSCTSSASQCDACDDGYGLVNGECLPCTDPHCLSCDGDVSKCTRCEVQWYLTAVATCSAVPCSVQYCEQCNITNPARCDKCEDGRIPDSETYLCITPGQCDVENCDQCSATSAKLCETCKPGYALSSNAKTCSATTTAAPTAAPTTSPTPAPTASCNMPHCTTCVSGNPNACEYCEAGYYVSNGQCVLVGNCYVGNCAQCMLRDSSKCSVCYNNYLLSTAYTCVSQHINVNGAAAPYSLWVAAAVLLASVATYLA